jgi:hypothetical protein
VAAWCIAAAGVRWYEEPTLARAFGAEYQAYRRGVRAWLPRLRPWYGLSDVAAAQPSQADRGERQRDQA